MDSLLLSILTCPKGCKGDLRVVEKEPCLEAPAMEYLQCDDCQSVYPVVSGVPVLFTDEHRTQFVLGNSLRAEVVREIERDYQHKGGELALHSSKKVENMAWEYFLSRTWATAERIGKGHKAFFESVMASEPSLKGKVMLNVGCGADPLLELFIEQGVKVVEQDIVLDGPLQLTSRGALGICCDLRHLPIRTGMFDIVTSYLTVHHIWPIEEPIGEMCRVLKAGGSLFVRESNDLSITSRVRRNLPSIVENPIVKLLAESGYAESPYEKACNPFHFVNCCRAASKFSTLELRYFIHPSSKYKGGSIFYFLTKIIPSLSFSFDVYGRKAHSDADNDDR